MATNYRQLDPLKYRDFSNSVDNYGMLNTRNVLTRRVATCSKYTAVFVIFLHIGKNSFSRNLPTDLCDADPGLTQPRVQHNMLK